MSDEPKPYDWIVATWLTTSLKQERNRTAFIRGDDVLAQPLASLAAIRGLLRDGHRVVIGRKKERSE